MAGAPVGSLSDYLAANQGLDAAGAALSDTGIGSLLGSIDPYTTGFSIITDLINLFGGPNLDPISNIISAFQGRPKEQATQDIASGAQAYSDPVIQLLGQGAQQLASKNIPISSSSGQANSFGNWFQVASDLENLMRWGTITPTAQQANLTATTLKNALTELGNPGQSGTDTLNALQQVYQQNPNALNAQNLKAIYNILTPAQQGILQNWTSQNDPSVAQQLGWNQGGPSSSSGTQPSSPQSQPQPPPAGSSLTPAQAQYQNQIQGYQNQYANYVNQYAQGGNPPPPTPPPPPQNPTPQQYQAYEQDYANYVQNYAQYVNQNAAAQPQPVSPTGGYPNYGGPQPGVYPSGGGQQRNFDPIPPPTQAQLQQLQQDAQRPGNIRSQTPGRPGQHLPPITSQPRPPGCPPCPSCEGFGEGGGSGGGNTTTGGNTSGGNTGTGTGSTGSGNTSSNQTLLQLLQQLFNQPGNRPNNPNNPNNPGNLIAILNQLLGNTTTTGPSTGSTGTGTTGTSTTSTPRATNPLQTLSNMATLGGLAGLFGSPGGFSYNWTVV